MNVTREEREAKKRALASPPSSRSKFSTLLNVFVSAGLLVFFLDRCSEYCAERSRHIALLEAAALEVAGNINAMEVAAGAVGREESVFSTMSTSATNALLTDAATSHRLRFKLSGYLALMSGRDQVFEWLRSMFESGDPYPEKFKEAIPRHAMRGAPFAGEIRDLIQVELRTLGAGDSLVRADDCPLPYSACFTIGPAHNHGWCGWQWIRSIVGANAVE